MKEVLEILIGENKSSKYLKKVYAEITEEVALSELSLLEEKLGTQYAIVSEAIGMSYQRTLNILKR